MDAAEHRSAPIDAPVAWTFEGADLGPDPDSGAAVRRLTSGPMMNHLIYCEQPYTSPDGKRVAIIRGCDFTFENDFSLLVAEPDSLRIARVERSIPRSIAHTSYSEWLYYLTHQGGLRRVSLLTLAKEQLLPDGSIPTDTSVQSITPDNEQIVCWEGPGRAEKQIVTYATRSSERRVLFTHPDNNNPHLQVEPVHGNLILLQLVPLGRVPVLVLDRDGSNRQTLPVGAPFTNESSGHMTWITGTERVVIAVEWDRAARAHDPRHPEGNLVITGPGDETPTIFSAPEHAVYHVSVSRCGTYFVADDFLAFELDAFRRGHIGPARIVVGNLRTGKYRTLIRDCQSYGMAGTSNWEPIPYLTADNRYVIYDASPFGVTQVFAARVPPEFLASLE
ncbi:hypothetical protein HQ590_02420 [bacterium]|nr:hypothetical protein [bacterium]